MSEAMVKIACPCLFGLESVLAGEARRMGFQDVAVTDGRVTFMGTKADIARANIGLRTAERVEIVLGEFRAKTFDQLFEGTAALPLEEWVGSLDAFPVKGWSINSKLHSIPDCQAIIKKAAAKRLGRCYGVQWLQETGAVHQIRFTILKDNASILLDTSGTPLYKRGYRPAANQAPIRETLAAGIADLARVREHTRLIDPCCGSGTFLIEGALKALKVPPGLKRRFAAEEWESIPATAWQQARQQGFENIRRDGTFHGVGYDIDANSMRLVHANASRAGVDSRLKVSQADLRDFKAPEEPFVLLANPPYGERMMEKKEAEEICRTMGRVFTPGEGRTYAVISPLENFEELFGRKAIKRRKLYNGMIRCQLYLYF